MESGREILPVASPREEPSMRHMVVIEIHTSELVTTEELAADVKFTMGEVAGGFIGNPDEHPFYGAENISVHAVKQGL